MARAPRRKRSPIPDADLLRFAERLKRARQKQKLTQTAVAQASQIDRTAIVRFEQAARPPTFGQLMALHDALDVPHGFLVAK